MIISLKDILKLFGISIVCFCAVFVCTFFLNYYIDVLPLKDSVSEEIMPLYTAQLAMAKMTCAITGGFLSVIAVIMLIFYIKLYIDGHRTAIGTLKAMGYSNFSIAKSFTLFGLSVLVGCGIGFAVGWACMPAIYDGLTLDGLPEISPSFHTGLLFCLVPAPTVVFTSVVYIYAALSLRKPTLELMKGESGNVKKIKLSNSSKNRPFLTEMSISTLKSRKMLVFFTAFSCFCFSAMVQMGLSMENLVEGTMGVLILAIGIVLSAVSLIMAMTSLVKNNARNIALMKATGFCKRECFIAIFSAFIPFAVLGFAVGTVYQYGLLKIMVNLIFKEVTKVPEYSFHWPVFFITLASFIFCYSAVFAFYLYRADKATIKTAFTVI